MPYMGGTMSMSKPMPKMKGVGKMKDEMDEEMEEIETGKKKPSTLSQARQSFAGTKIKRPRLGGMMVGQ